MLGDGDLETIFANGDFDTAAVFTISSGPTVTLTVRGWFQEATEAVSIYTGEIEANDASFTCETADVATVKNEMTVVINSVTYTVKRKQKMGTGVTLIYLKT
jgi:flagellar capping protein FliD